MIPTKYQFSKVGKPSLDTVEGEDRNDSIDVDFVSHYGFQTFAPHNNQIGQEGTPFAVNSRLKRRGDWIEGGKL